MKKGIDLVLARRKLTLIGIGPGGPRQITLEAVDAIAATDVFLVLDKGDEKADLLELRNEILRAHAGPHRVVELADPVRDASDDYGQGVADWHAARAALLERALVEHVAEGEHAGMLVWGDPSLYDSALRLVEAVNGRGVVDIDHAVVPAVSSVQLLAARHRIVLNRVGGSVLITTGRRLLDELAARPDCDVVVMLDGSLAFTQLVGRGYHIYWAAFLGMPGEILVAGPLDDVATRIAEVRAEARRHTGWIFDIYLLRAPP